MNIAEFSDLRYGMFVHYGLFSMLGRGEWVMNREKIPPEEMAALASRFRPERFDADAICRLAVDGGMKYLVFTTMHHEGFRLYDTVLTDYNSVKSCGRNLVAEITEAARKHGLKIGLYHSLNNWFDQPDAVAALEHPQDYELFLQHTFQRLKELVTVFNPIDILWYDGWWPFNEDGWRAEQMNAEMRKIQPHLLFNGRNCLPGDFGTPEGHITAPTPWRPWEACMTLNDHWGFHRADENWKSPLEVINMLLQCANGKGNLLLNIGPRSDGSVPEQSVEIVRTVGAWLKSGGSEAITNTDLMTFGPLVRTAEERSDWDSAGVFTASGKDLYLTLLYNPGVTLTLTGLEMKVESISVAGIGELPYEQKNDKLTVTLPTSLAHFFCPVLRMRCDRVPSIYRTGGMRVPQGKHPRYDPIRPDIKY